MAVKHADRTRVIYAEDRRCELTTMAGWKTAITPVLRDGQRGEQEADTGGHVRPETNIIILYL